MIIKNKSAVQFWEKVRTLLSMRRPQPHTTNPRKEEKEKKVGNKNKEQIKPTRKKNTKKFVQIKNIWYYNVHIQKLKLLIKYFNLNITLTSHAEKVSMLTRQISDARLSLLW